MIIPPHIYNYFACIFLGWATGANHSGNVFGTAVASRMLSYRVAVALIALFVILGAVLGGEPGIITISQKLQTQNPQNLMQNATIITLSAAIGVTVLTLLKLPASTAQAVIGAIAGFSAAAGQANWAEFGKILTCWILAPLGGLLLTVVIYFLLAPVFRRLKMSIFTYDPVMRLMLIIVGCYGSYALGANNAANVAGVFVGPNMLSTTQAAWFAGFAMALGALTYSRPVMMTVGGGVVRLDAFFAFICVFSHALTVHLFAILGVPVSTTQAIIGSIIGISVIKGIQVLNVKNLATISMGWICAPILTALLAALGFFISNLSYQPN